MAFQLTEAIDVLKRTPDTLSRLLAGLPEAWIRTDEGKDTWSPYDVVGHLIPGERTDWIARARVILEDGESRAFEPFDRTAMLRMDRTRPLAELLEELARLRAVNLEALAAMKLDDAALDRRGTHPDFGPVTLRQLLATWVVHDLGHIAQVTRVMARRLAGDVGPWAAYLPVLTRR